MSKPLILAIDDDQFYLDEIRMEIEDHADYKLFLGPNDFEQRITPEDIKAASLVLVDYDYGSGTAVKSQLAEYIRQELNFKGKLVLCSLHEFFMKDEKRVRQDYDTVLHKRDLSWEKLKGILEQAKK
jgi:hypothetical protein